MIARLPVQVRTHEGRAPVPLDEGTAQLVRLALEGELQQARLALLQGRTALYDDALVRAQTLLARWFVARDPGVQAFADALDELAALDATRALPEIGEASAALQRARAGRAPEGGQ